MFKFDFLFVGRDDWKRLFSGIKLCFYGLCETWRQLCKLKNLAMVFIKFHFGNKKLSKAHISSYILSNSKSQFAMFSSLI